MPCFVKVFLRRVLQHLKIKRLSLGLVNLYLAHLICFATELLQLKNVTFTVLTYGMIILNSG